MKQDVLFELGCEELPSALVEVLGQALFDGLLQSFKQVNLPHGSAKWFATPRRIACLIEDVDALLPSQEKVRRGPKQDAGLNPDGQPSQALLGFARSCGVDYQSLGFVTTEKGEVYYEYRSREVGQPLKSFLPQSISSILKNLPIPKPMRWGEGEFHFARPVHWIVLLHGQDVIEADFFGVKAGRISYGHRFMHPEAIEIPAAREYPSAMHSGFVIASFNERRAEIIQQIETLASVQQWHIPLPAALIHEITSIVEWPVLVLGDYDREFLDLPEAVLIASMQQHQKCLAVYNQSQQLLPHFVGMSNIESQDQASVKRGNEKVIRARLSDAMFFYQQDRRQPLIQYAGLCDTVTFEQRLGSLADKNQRVLRLALYLAKSFAISAAMVSRAVELSKCDLMTGMVAEFPELQGTIGEFYARGDGEPDEISSAMFEQYLPRFSGDDLPKSHLGLILSLAERLDTLMGIFAIGMKPNGEKDPYKLRRHALAVVRLLLSQPNQLDINLLLNLAREGYEFLTISDDLIEELQQFIAERMQSYFLQQGFSLDAYQAAYAAAPTCYYDMALRLASYAKFMQSEQALILVQAAKRVRQILSQNPTEASAVNPNLLQELAEQNLWQLMQDLKEGLTLASQHQDYDQSLQDLLVLSPALADFFASVFVMADDLALRQNRLNLLKNLQMLLQTVVHIS